MVPSDSTRKEITVQSFDELALSSPLQRSIRELGFEKPSPIQAEALPLLLGEPTDFIGLAATGTGKTAAFSIPFLEKMDAKKKAVQVLVLCPTRELAIQVAGQVDLLGKYKGVSALPIYGGAGYREQFYGLDMGASVVVGTPGRVVDHLKRGSLKLDQLQLIVLDEADEMISMGFKEDMEAILEAAPRDNGCNTWLFSATMSREVRKVAEKFLVEPKQVQINRNEMLPQTIEQLYYFTQERNKPEVLCKLIEAADDFYGIIFCQTKSLVTDLSSYLMERGYRVDCLHGDMNQAARERTMQLFRDRKVRILVCTDVAARGLDVKDITHVINFSIPRELDNYVHRIGRTGRSGKTGYAMSLVTPSHRRLIFQIEQMTKSKMKEGVIPSRREVATKKISRLLPKFQEQKNFSRAIEVLDESWLAALNEMTKEEIAARFIASAMPEIFADDSIPQMSRPERASQGERQSDRGPRTRPASQERASSSRPSPYERTASTRPSRLDRAEMKGSDEAVEVKRSARPAASRPAPQARSFSNENVKRFERSEEPRRERRSSRQAVFDGDKPLNRKARRDMARAQGALAPIDPSTVPSLRRAMDGNRPPSRSAR